MQKGFQTKSQDGHVLKQILSALNFANAAILRTVR
jgi:hypothetical protein